MGDLGKFLSVFLLAGSIAGCSGPGGSTDGTTGTLALTGSSTIAPLASEIAKRFEKAHPGVRIDVQTGGSSRGIADVRAGRADIGMASRELKEGELELQTHRLALDGVCLIVHRDNPVLSLTDEQVVSIYTGETDRWSGLGGSDSGIVVVNKAEGRGTLEVFLQYFGLDNSRIRADIIVGENQQAIKTVAGNPTAIAYVSVGAVKAAVEEGAAIKALRAGDRAPTAENVANGTFPVVRTLYWVTRDQPTGLVKDFIEFSQSSQVDDLVEAFYFVPIQR